MKQDNSIVLTIMDYKQNINLMRYHELQVEYFEEKVISLLGMMEIR